MSVILDLSPELKADRLTGIGGGDASRIMKGEWQALWLEKTGRETPKKIMSDWDYYLRISTEVIQLNWWEHKTGQRIVRREWPENSVRSVEYPWMRATLDGMIEETGEPINAKHLSAWTKQARVWAVEHYIWQILHEIIVLSPPSMRGWISLIVGEREPEPIAIDADPVSLQKLIAAEREFWTFVENDTPPDGNYASEISLIEWEKMREVEMTGNNEWAISAGIWGETRDAWKRCNDARDDLRKLVDADVREAWGHGVIVTRNRAGALTIKEHLNGRD